MIPALPGAPPLSRPFALRAPLRSILVAVVAFAAAVPVFADDAPALPNPDAPGLTTVQRLAALLARIKVEQAKLRSLEADFVQRKESALLLAPEESKGRFAFQAPDKVVWEFETPSEIVVLIAGDEMLTWYRDLGTAEKVGIGKQSSRIFQFLGAANSLETLQRYFTVKVSFPAGDAPYRLDLEPRFERVAKKLKTMSLELDRKLFFPVRIAYVEPDGDETVLDFADVRVNPTIPPARFDVRLPADVQVTAVGLAQ